MGRGLVRLTSQPKVDMGCCEEVMVAKKYKLNNSTAE